MAVQYIITPEEMLSLIDQLKLEAMQERNVLRKDYDKPPTMDEMHRAFHFVVVRWAQDMGFKTTR